jgi:hypothetical protein
VGIGERREEVTQGDWTLDRQSMVYAPMCGQRCRAARVARQQ